MGTQRMVQQRGVHERQAEQLRDALVGNRVEQRRWVKAALDDERGAHRHRGSSGRKLSAVEHRQDAREHVFLVQVQAGDVGHQRRVHGAVRVHRALGPARGAAGVHDEREIAVIDHHGGQCVGVALQRLLDSLRATGNRFAKTLVCG